MAQTRTNTNPSTSTGGSTLLRVFQIFAALAVVNVLVQFLTAGQLVSGDAVLQTHGTGAIVLHVLSGVAALAAVLLWRGGRLSLGVALLAAVVFLFTFVQAALGDFGSLYVHVPGAMVLTAGVTWVLVASLRRSTPADPRG